jgi:hypothetical protein
MMGNQLVSGGLGAARGIVGAGEGLAMGAGLINWGTSYAASKGLMASPLFASRFIGTAAGSSLGMGLLGGPVGLGLLAAQTTLGLAQTGVHNANMVGNMFGNMQFANAAGDPRTGRGFSQRDLMTLQRGIHNIEANNPFVSMSDALRATERFTEMGMHQGVQDAEKLAKRVTQLGKTMHEMARQLGTSMEEAGTFLRDMRGSGFYSARDVMGNTANMTLMRGFGMTSEQFAGMQRAGAGITRGSMMSGKAGAGMVTAKAAEFMQAFNSGAMSSEQAMDMTGASTPLEAAQMLAQQTLSGTMQGLSGGLGSAMLLAAGQVDESGKFTGKVDAGILQRMASGSMTRDEMMRIGGLKRNTREGQMSFVARTQDITESMLESEQGQEALFGMIRSLTEQQFGEGMGDDQDAFQLVAETQLNMDRRTVRNLQKLRDTRRQRMAALAQELRTSERAAELKESRTLGGLVTKISGTFSDIYEGATMPFSEFYTETIGGFQDAERILLGGGDDVTAGLSQRTVDQSLVASELASLRGQGSSSVKLGIGDVARLAAASGDVGSIRGALPTLTEETKKAVGGRDVAAIVANFKEKGYDISDPTMKRILAQLLGVASLGGDRDNYDQDQLHALLAEQGGEIGQKLAVQANLDRFDGGSSTKDLKQLQKDMKDAMQGGFMLTDVDSYGDSKFAKLFFAGGLTAIDTDAEEAIDRLQTGGEGTALLEKYSDNQAAIDRILGGVVTDEEYETAAKQINAQFGLKVTAGELKDVNTVLTHRTGKSATDRRIGGVSKEIKDSLSGAAKALSKGTYTEKETKQLQSLITAATAAGLSLEGSSDNSKIQDAIKQLAAKGFTATTQDDLATRTLGLGVEVFQQLKVSEKGGLTIDEAVSASGLDKETLTNLITGMGGSIGERGIISTSDSEQLRATIAGMTTKAVGISAKQEQFLNAGMSETERQSLSVFKTAQMVDSLYEKLKAEKIISISSPEGGGTSRVPSVFT